MSRRSAVADALGTWREAERLLVLLPASSDDHALVLDIEGEARGMYEMLTNMTAPADSPIALAREVVAKGKATLDAVRRRHPELWSTERETCVP